jgi:hypothetical protein
LVAIRTHRVSPDRKAVGFSCFRKNGKGRYRFEVT